MHRESNGERGRASQVAAAVDQLVQDPEAPILGLAPEDEQLLGTVRRLSRLPSLLGPANPALEQRLVHRLRLSAVDPARRPHRFGLGWAIAGAVVMLLAVTLLTPLGQTAVASFLAVFNLGRTEVRITPVDAALATLEVQGTAVERRLTPEIAHEVVPFPLMQPAYVPAGYRLREMTGYTYPDMPAWVPQPFSVAIVYEDSQGHDLSLHLYPITLGQGTSSRISGMDLRAGPIQDVKDVDVSGQPGVLLQLGEPGGEPTWQEVVWEQDRLMLALSASDLAEAELLRVARSVH